MTPIEVKSRMSAEERREQLLDVAKQLVGEQGFHGTTIEAIARRAGITRPVVYSHFADLDALLEAMLERESRRGLSQLAEVIPSEPGDDPREALLGALRRYLETVSADPVTWRLVLMPPEGAPAVLRRQITEGRDAVVASLAQLVGSGMGPGPDSPDPELTARTISAIADEGARLMLTDPKRYPIERQIEHSRWLLTRLSASA